MSALLDHLLPAPTLAACAANDAQGRGRINGAPGEFSTAWAEADARYWKAFCRNARICAACGEHAGRHEDGCANAPEVDE